MDFRPLARWNGAGVAVHLGDITTLPVDAVVNAANSQLWAGSGVCGAIHRAGGPSIAQECGLIIARISELAVGHAVITSGGNLPARHVIHAVGPVYDDDPVKAPKLLASAYRRSLAVAREHRLRSVAFPCISTGVYGYPPDEACQVAITAVKEDLGENNKLDLVVFCVFDETNRRLYEAAVGG